jgi:hypothetical protein
MTGRRDRDVLVGVAVIGRLEGWHGLVFSYQAVVFVFYEIK